MKKNKQSEIQKEIDEYTILSNDSSVPPDEREFAKEEIAELKKKLEGSKSTPKKSIPKRWSDEQDKQFDRAVKNYRKTGKLEKPAPYNCDDLIAKAKERKAHAKKMSNAPKKTDATKIKEAITKVEKKVEKTYDKKNRSHITKLLSKAKSLVK